VLVAALTWRRERLPPTGHNGQDCNRSKLRFSSYKEPAMLQRIEMDEHVPLADQLANEVGPVTLINTFKVAPEDADTLLEAWAADAAYLKTKPGFISTQLYRGIAGSGVFVNQAVWESVEAFRNAFGDPQFQATFARYPDSTVASPHLFQKVAVPGICVDR
jgi:heme-degrading monooxygenase HmoA